MLHSQTSAPAETQRFVQMFDEAEQTTYTARQESERYRDYYDGNQLTSEEVEALKSRGQPPIVINRIRRKIDYLRGLEAQRRTDPKAFPRTPDHAQAAEAATDAIRFVCDKEDWDEKRSSVIDNMLVEGFGGVEVVHEQRETGVEVVINHYAWDRLFYDPHSTRNDFSDARYLGAVIWTDADVLKEQYGKKVGEIQWTLDDATTSDTYDDRPKIHLWADPTRNRVRVVLMYYRENGVWHWCKFTKGGKLESGESPYVDDQGDSVCPLIIQSIYCDRENNRYGVVKDMIDPQDEVNKRRSKALHLLTMRQFRYEDGAIENVEQTRRELARPDGAIKTAPDSIFEILNNNDLASGQISLLQEAMAEMDLMGANSALAGDTGESASGRAVLARQQGGLIEIAATFDQLHQLTKRVYEHVWMRVRQFWTEERWIRVTDDDRNVRFVGLNRPVTVGETIANMPEEQALEVANRIGLQINDPRMNLVQGIENNVAEMEVDIQIEEVPEQVSMDAEQFQAIAQLGPALVQGNPMFAPVVYRAMIESAPGLRTDVKDRLLEAIEEAEATSVQGGQMQQQIALKDAQVELMLKEANVAATHAKARKDVMDAERI